MQTSLPFSTDGSAATASPAKAPPSREGTGAGPDGGGAAAPSSTYPPPPPGPSADPAAAGAAAGRSASASPPRSDTARLSAELRAAVVRELARAWHFINGSHFRSALLPPTIGLHPGQSRLGMWQAATRTLSLAEDLVMSRPWGVVLEVLKHEMAHQYVHEILGQTTETAHGPAFQAVCARLGIDATAVGLKPPPTDAATEADADHSRLLRRVARLLALAESQNPHEAEAAMYEAQRLMLKHNLDRQQVGRAGAAPRARYGFRQLGEPRGRTDEAQRLLAMLLGKYFFVEAIWVPGYDPRCDRRGTVLEICGSEDNLEMAAYVHGFLTHTAERLWAAHKQAAGITADRDRRTYLAGVMLGFAERLAEKERQHQVEGLVWAGDRVLQDYFRRRYPHVRRVQQKGQPRTPARAEGKKAGREIVLSRPLRSGATPGGPRAALPGRRED